MKRNLLIIFTTIVFLGCEKKPDELASKALDPHGPAVSEVFVIRFPEGNNTWRHGHSDRWLGGKSSSGGIVPKPYKNGWWFDLILPNGSNEGSAFIGWDPIAMRGFVICRSWQNINLRFEISPGDVRRFKHRPVDLRPLSQWDFESR